MASLAILDGWLLKNSDVAHPSWSSSEQIDIYPSNMHVILGTCTNVTIESRVEDSDKGQSK